MPSITLTFATIILVTVTGAPGQDLAVTAAEAMLDLPFGQARTAVLSLLQTQVEHQMHQAVRGTNEPIQRERIRKDHKDRIASLSGGYTSTERARGPYKLAPISSAVAVGEGAGVVRETTLGEPRWLLFYGDRLYGAAITLPSDRPMPKRALALSGRLGKSASTMRRGGKTGDVIAVRWERDDKEIQIKDLSTEYGVLLLTVLDAKLWQEAREATVRNVKDDRPDDKKPADDLLKEFLP